MIFQYSSRGLHGIWDAYGISFNLLDNEVEILQVLKQAAQAVHANILQAHTHYFGENMGVTGVLMLAESHISIHTWPEHGYAAVDIFMCGNQDLEPALLVLKKYFQPQKSTWNVLERGREN